jgi:histidine triad (HIT) family protein
MLSPEQISQIKNQLIQQIESSFPEDKKNLAKQQIEEMNQEQLEEFLVQNNLIKTPVQPEETEKCIFCSIISGKTFSYKIDKNKVAVAVLEINPISKGHVLIIPKEHIASADRIPAQALSLAKKIAGKLRKKFKPKDVLIHPDNIFGHQIINVIPVYSEEKIISKRTPAKKEELEKVMKILEVKKKPAVIKPQKIKKIESEKLWLPKRIP